MDKVAELAVGGSVINRATRSSFTILVGLCSDHQLTYM